VYVRNDERPCERGSREEVHKVRLYMCVRMYARMHERVYDVCMMYVCVCGKAKMAGMDRMYPRYGWMDVCVCMYVCMCVCTFG